MLDQKNVTAVVEGFVAVRAYVAAAKIAPRYMYSTAGLKLVVARIKAVDEVRLRSHELNILLNFHSQMTTYHQLAQS